ncbi:hypothetical protein PEWE109479_28660 [Pedobacter westerhofensis]
MPPLPWKVMVELALPAHISVVPLIVAVGSGLTFTVAVPVCALLQAVLLASETLNKV